MNYISTLLSILQERESTMQTPIYIGKYIVQIVISRTQRRLSIREVNGNNNEMIDMFVGSGVGVVKDATEYGIQHYSRKHSEPSYTKWYQLFSPSNEITSIKYCDVDSFVTSDLCVIDLHQEEDLFQKSTIVDVDIDVINSLILEQSQLQQYIAISEKALVLISGYEKIDFGILIEGLQ